MMHDVLDFFIALSVKIGMSRFASKNSVGDTIAEDLDRKLQSRRVVEIVDRVLEPREREIIVLRYGLGGKKPITQRETAEFLGISRSYVSRIEKAALEKIAKNLERLPL